MLQTDELSMLKIQEKLADKYQYKKLSAELSEKYRQLWKDNLPDGLDINGSDITIYTKDGIMICEGYERVVIGDYGAFIEYNADQACKENYIIQPGQEYRVNDPRYSKNVKYNWLTIEGSGIKIYEQKKGVVYADYKPGHYYISPHEDIVFGYSVNPKKKGKGTITISFDTIPKHCGECALYINNLFVEDEPSWGSGILHYCPFGADYHGCLVERPEGCPIQIEE